MLNVCRAFIPYMRGTSGEKAIANYGSVASWVAGPGYALYNGTKFACTGITEALALELAPFDIKATSIEPGYFRTDFLHGGAVVKLKVQLKEYDETAVGEVRSMLNKMNNNQRGDVIKGCRVIVDILTHSGVAEGRDIPVRIALGSDAPPMILKKIKETVELLTEWEDITTSTDHE